MEKPLIVLTRYYGLLITDVNKLLPCSTLIFFFFFPSTFADLDRYIRACLWLWDTEHRQAKFCILVEERF